MNLLEMMKKIKNQILGKLNYVKNIMIDYLKNMHYVI